MASALSPKEYPPTLFWVLSKSLDVLLAPLTWALLFVFAGVAFHRRRTRSLAFLIAGLATLLAFSTEPVAAALVARTESPERTFRPGEPYDAAIVLGGVLDAEATRILGQPQYSDGGARVLAVAELLRSGAARDVLVSGGSGNQENGVLSEAELIEENLIQLGVPREHIVVEKESRNTRENAIDSKPIIERQGWKRLVLVTHAAHMPRAVGCFRAVGIEVDTYPVGYHPLPAHSGAAGLFPRAHNLAETTDSIHELAGRAVYRALGYSRSEGPPPP
jgi:uncharacterized SAM-binding protein YcdF (DUF218 family)